MGRLLANSESFDFRSAGERADKSEDRVLRFSREAPHSENFANTTPLTFPISPMCGALSGRAVNPRTLQTQDPSELALSSGFPFPVEGRGGTTTNLHEITVVAAFGTRKWGRGAPTSRTTSVQVRRAWPTNIGAMFQLVGALQFNSLPIIRSAR